MSARAPTDVVFVVMPFADLGRPAIGVSLLETAVRAAGRSAAIEYCNIDFADRLGQTVYGAISSGMAPDMLVGRVGVRARGLRRPAPAAARTSSTGCS